MLAHRLRRWPSIDPAVGERYVIYWIIPGQIQRSMIEKQTRAVSHRQSRRYRCIGPYCSLIIIAAYIEKHSHNAHINNYLGMVYSIRFK